MTWFILVFAFVLLAFHSRGFRRFSVDSVVVPVAIALVVFAWSESRARHRDAAERTRIPAGQVELSDMRMLVQPDVLNELTGLVKNHSKTYTLTSFNLRITLQDCDAGRCETVGQEEQTISPLVPPGGTGQLSTTVYFAHLGQPRGIRRLSYTVTGTRSEGR